MAALVDTSFKGALGAGVRASVRVSGVSGSLAIEMLYLFAMIVVVLLYGHRGYQDSDDDGNDDVVTGDHQDDNADDHDADDAVDAGEVIVGLERFLRFVVSG